MVETMAIKYFDTLEYVRKSKEIKDPGDLAEYQIKQIELAIETAVQYARSETVVDVRRIRDEINKEEWATKHDIQDMRYEIKDVKNDLELKIANLRFEMIKFIVWTGIGSVVTLGSILGTMIAKLGHWI